MILKIALEGDKFDPKLGIGQVLIGSDVLPACSYAEIFTSWAPINVKLLLTDPVC
jgi:hypothetical protein